MRAKLIMRNAREFLTKRRDCEQAHITEFSSVPDCDLSHDLVEFRKQLKQFVSLITQVVYDAPFWERAKINPIKIDASHKTIEYTLERNIRGKVFIFNDAFWRTPECISDDDGQKLVIEAAQKPITKFETSVAQFRHLIAIAGTPEVRPVIAIATFLFFLLVCITGAACDAPWLSFLGGLGSFAGAFMIMKEFARDGDRSPRRWGESVWEAAGRQGKGGSTGCGLIIGLTLVVLSVVGLFSGDFTIVLLMLFAAIFLLPKYLE